jgi:adenosylmethionine-8-amino-7-oxononanoate aminotransferase
MNKLARLDHDFIWHPFTQMRDWLKHEPIVIIAGKGATLKAANGRTYLDANSSIWTNLHGHNHPAINDAITRQLKNVAHTSALGLANEPASLLAKRLIQIALGASDNFVSPATRRTSGVAREASSPPPRLTKVFFSDDGSTAMEVALKLAYEFSRRTRRLRYPTFLSLDGAYHGDTVGAVSLGHVDLFHKAYSGLLFQTDKVAAPYCYRCPYNRAKPERADARDYRKCNWECMGELEAKFTTQKKGGNPYAAFVFEPLIQGAAGMIAQPTGWLGRATEIARHHGALLIADEVMTGFGRTGIGNRTAEKAGQTGRGATHQPTHSLTPNPPLFACQREGVTPDFLALAKGLTGGYLPMAATLTTQPVFNAFLGEYDEFKTFFHGHSYTANQLGAAAALASADQLQSRKSITQRATLEQNLRTELKKLWSLPNVGDIRQVGLVAGIELVKDWRTRKPFRLRDQAGIRVCQAMAKRGVLTRPIGNVLVIMPPYCTSAEELHQMMNTTRLAIAETHSRK